MKYLSLDGVTYLWSKIKSVFIKKSDALTYEEIQASTDLTGKVSSGNASKEIISVLNKKGYAKRVSTNTDYITFTVVNTANFPLGRGSFIVHGNGNGSPYYSLIYWDNTGSGGYANYNVVGDLSITSAFKSGNNTVFKLKVAQYGVYEIISETEVFV